MTKSAFILFLCPIMLFAAIKEWELNRDHSFIEFEIPYLVVSKVRGKFEDFSAKYSQEIIEVEIKAESINTDNRVRDGHLKEKDFFHAKKFPLIHFKSTQVSLNEVSGILSILGLKKKITFKTNISKIEKDTWNKNNLFINLKTQLSLKEIGINWNKTLPESKLVLGDNVKIIAVFQFQPKGQKTSGYKYKIPDTEYIRMREQVQRGEREALPISKLKFEEPAFKEVQISKRKTLEKRLDRKEEKKIKADWSLYLALFYMSFTTFAVLLIVSFYIKKKNIEANKVGFYSDFLCLLIAFLFALSIAKIWQIS